MIDRTVSRQLKGKVLNSCVVPSCMCSSERVALTEVERRGMDDLREEILS